MAGPPPSPLRIPLSVQPLRVRATPAVDDGDLETAPDVHVAGAPLTFRQALEIPCLPPFGVREPMQHGSVHHSLAEPHVPFGLAPSGIPGRPRPRIGDRDPTHALSVFGDSYGSSAGFAVVFDAGYRFPRHDGSVMQIYTQLKYKLC